MRDEHRVKDAAPAPVTAPAAAAAAPSTVL